MPEETEKPIELDFPREPLDQAIKALVSLFVFTENTLGKDPEEILSTVGITKQDGTKETFEVIVRRQRTIN